MASSSSNPLSSSKYDPSPLANNTTFVQADPSTFRAVVQKLTGTNNPSLPLTGKFPSVNIGPRRPPFKLHERRQSVAGARKLEIKLMSHGGFGLPFGGRVAAAMASSPVSTLDGFPRGSPRTPPPQAANAAAAEERAIAEKGFYLHRSPLSTPRGGAEPELLTLFPLHSPRD